MIWANCDPNYIIDSAISLKIAIKHCYQIEFGNSEVDYMIDKRYKRSFNLIDDGVWSCVAAIINLLSMVAVCRNLFTFTLASMFLVSER